MILDEVSFTNPRGQRLAATLHRPSDDLPSWGALIAHGMLSARSSSKHVAIASAVAELGGGALRFDFAGRGESVGDPTDLTITGELADLETATGWLRSRGISRIALIGSSLGGTVALLHAAVDPEIAALVTIAAPARLPDAPRQSWGGRGRRRPGGLVEVAPGELIRERFFIDAGRHHPLAAAARVGCPWLIIHGTQDDVVPSEDGSALAAAASHTTLVAVPGADHRSFSDRHLELLMVEVRGFLRAHLVDRNPVPPVSLNGGRHA